MGMRFNDNNQESTVWISQNVDADNEVNQDISIEIAR